MDDLIQKQFDEMCRTCMCMYPSTQESTTDLQSIFDFVEENKIQIFELLNKTVKDLEKIEITDALPKNICTRCVKKLCDFNDFRILCIHSDQHFRKLLALSVEEEEQKQCTIDPLQNDAGIEEFAKREIIFGDLEPFAEDEPFKSALDNESIDNNYKDILDSETEYIENNAKKVKLAADETEEMQYSCDICKKSFLYKRNLLRHAKYQHSATEKQAGQIIADASIEENESFNDSMETDSDKETTNKIILEEKSEIERVYLCEICDIEFAYKKNLKRHMKRAHDFEIPKDIILEADERSSKQISNLTKKVDNRIWTCEICKTEFLYKRNLRRHMKRTHKEENVIEIEATNGIPIIVKDEMQISESSVEDWDIPVISIWTCEKCQKTFSYKKNLKRHMKSIHNEELSNSEVKCNDNSDKSQSQELFKCNECDSVFYKKVYLRKHKYRHKRGLKRKEKNCELCGFSCTNLQNLRDHFSACHPDHLEAKGNQLLESLKLYICQYCNKSFQQTSTLKDHIRIHTKEQPFLCSHCGKAFNSNSNFRQHILRHEKDKMRYECPDCPKKFPCLSDLASHKQVHSQVKPHVCDICGAAFGKPYQLKTHKKYHNGEKRYQCEYCAMRFVCGDHLKRHIRIHTGEKPYKCKYCERSFSQSNDMIKHLRLHLGENVYQCELCPAAFRLAAELRTHFSSHKNDDDETREKNRCAWQEAQEKLRLKLESERPNCSKTKETSYLNSETVSYPDGGDLLVSTSTLV